jgi:hypothetical protein
LNKNIIITIILFSVTVLFLFILNDKKSFFMGNLYPSSNCKNENLFIKNINYDDSLSIENISIQMGNVSNYFLDIFNILSDNSTAKILDKNYRQSTLKIFYTNGVVCNFLAQIRIHGGKKDHIDVSSANLNWENENIKNLDYNVISSLRIKLMNGHIQNMNDFILFIPKTRHYDNEIFISSLFKELNFLSPKTFYTKINFYGYEKKVIFQETPNKNFLQFNKRKNGPILAGNRIKIWDDNIYNQAALSRIKNYGGLDIGLEEHRKIILKGISKLNESLLILRNHVLNEGFLILKNYSSTQNKKFKDPLNLSWIYPYLSNLYHNDEIGYKNMSAYEAFMIATGSAAGLSSEDRRYYYDAVHDRFEPIYYDGMSRILDSDFNFKNELDIEYNINYSKYIYDGSNNALSILSKLSIIDFNKILNKNGIIQSLESTQNYKEKILKNLKYLKRKTKDNFSSNFNMHIIDNINNFKLIFGGNNLNFEICDIELTDCFMKNFNLDQFEKLIRNQIYEENNYLHRYISLSKKKYKKRIISKSSGLKNFYFDNLNSTTRIFYNRDGIVEIDKVNKIININNFEEIDRVVIEGGRIKDWKIFFEGIETKDINYKSDENNLSGCINFNDVVFENISIFGRVFPCPDAVNFHNSIGKIDKLDLSFTNQDAFDADFSNITVTEIKIHNVGNDCIGMKTGNFIFELITLSGCQDKAVSAGDMASIKISEIFIENSSVGIYAKNSSEIILEDVEMYDVETCIYAERKEYKFSGSIIKLNKDNLNCDNKTLFSDQDSYLLNL